MRKLRASGRGRAFAWVAGAVICGSTWADSARVMLVGVGTHLALGRSVHLTQDVLRRQPWLSMRDEVFWGRVEVRPGTFDMSKADTVLRGIAESGARGQSPLVVLDYGNAMYGGGLPKTDREIAAYARYAAEVAKDLKGKVTLYEIWNEWNSGLGSGSPPTEQGTAERYVNLLKQTYLAIRAVDPSAIVVGGAVSWVDIPWIQRFGELGGFQFIDGFSVHPYVYTQKQLAVGTRPTGSKCSIAGMEFPASHAVVCSSPSGTPESAIGALDSMRAIITHFTGRPNFPVYITEVGWTSGVTSKGIPEELVGAYLQRLLLLLKVRPWVAGVWWYDLVDDGDDLHSGEDNFGLLTRNGREKPAYNALLSLKDIMQSPVPATTSVEKSGVIVFRQPENSGGVVTVAWLPVDNLEDSVKWKCPCDPATCDDRRAVTARPLLFSSTCKE